MAISLGIGTALKRNGVTIAKTQSIEGPSGSRDFVDVTAHDSVGGAREFLNGLLDWGEVTFDLIYDGTDTGVQGDFLSGAAVPWSIVFPTAVGVTWSFSAFVTSFSASIPTDDAVKMSVTLKVAGAVTIGAS